MGYVECTRCGWWAHFSHMIRGRCPKCGGQTQSLDAAQAKGVV